MPVAEIFCIYERLEKKETSTDLFGIKSGFVIGSLPTVKTPVRVFARIRYHQEDAGKHAFAIAVVHPDRQPDVFPLGETELECTQGHESYDVIQLNTDLPVNFRMHGEHYLHLLFDRETVGEFLFEVVADDCGTEPARN